MRLSPFVILMTLIAASIVLIMPYGTYAADSTNQVQWLQLMQKGSLARQAGNLQQAEKYWREALDLSNRFAIDQSWQDQNLKCLMSIIDEQGKCNGLEDFLRLLVAQRKGDTDNNPSMIWPLDCLGQSLYCSGKLLEAEATFKQALDIADAPSSQAVKYVNDVNADILIRLAQLHIKTGKSSEAEEEARKALRLLDINATNANQAKALREMASAITESNRALEAVALSRYAKDLYSAQHSAQRQSTLEQLRYSKVLANAYMKAWLYQKAIPELQIAISKAKQLGNLEELNLLSNDLQEAKRLSKLKVRTGMSFGQGNYKWTIPADLIF